MSKTLREVYFETFTQNFRFAAQLASLPGKEPVTVEQTILSRMADKLSRLKSLIVHPEFSTNDESVMDTVKDLFVYTNILLTYLQLGQPGPDTEYREEETQEAIAKSTNPISAAANALASSPLAKLFNWPSAKVAAGSK